MKKGLEMPGQTVTSISIDGTSPHPCFVGTPIIESTSMYNGGGGKEGRGVKKEKRIDRRNENDSNGGTVERTF